MAVGRDMPPPEEADSWAGVWWVVWQVVGALLFVAGLLFCAYAFSDRHWWMWLCSFAAFAAVFSMAARAKTTMDREAERAAEIEQLERMWQARLERRSPPR
jgi:hypothetical protein